MDSTAASRSSAPNGLARSAAASTRDKSPMSPGVQNACTPGVSRAKRTPRSMSSSEAAGSYHEVAQRPVVAGPEKARLIREHAALHGYDLKDCFAYSDSYSDVPMLSVVGHPAAVNPDLRLGRLAKSYGWPVLALTPPS